MSLLTDANYYSFESNQEYMSVSQYKDFLKCEAMAMAKIHGGFEIPQSGEMLLGSYVHSWNDGTMEQFTEEHPDLFSSQGKTKGQLKATYKIADRMIETLSTDTMVMTALEGGKEIILVADYAGARWKMKADVLNLDKHRVVDLKTCKELSDKCWNIKEKCYQSWLEYYGYLIQMAVYQKLVKLATGVDVEPLIVTVSKEDPPDKAIIYFDNERLQYELSQVEFYLPHFLKVKSGEIEAKRCERCECCRQSKKVNKVIHYSELMN